MYGYINWASGEPDNKLILLQGEGYGDGLRLFDNFMSMGTQGNWYDLNASTTFGAYE